jgi:formamidopyrimidine-DNA glycosylase
MPELPEVETFRQRLLRGQNGSPSILGKKISGSSLLWEKTHAEPTPTEFAQQLPGQYVTGIGRRGKYLLVHLSLHTLIFHLRMSGEIIIESQLEPIQKHYRLLIDFEDGDRLAFNNIRKFGRVWLVLDPHSIVGKLGPEPLDDQFSPADLHALLHSRNRQLKYFLLDQEIIAGLGNIYTDESLHLARLHPKRISSTLTESESRKLWECIRQVLTTGIKNQGSSIDWMYRGGDYQRLLNVYNLEGKPCKTCGTPIKKTRVAQRGTYYCPHCQPVTNS